MDNDDVDDVLDDIKEFQTAISSAEVDDVDEFQSAIPEADTDDVEEF